MNRNGFTLIEVLAVIALIGVILLFVMPNLVKIFSNSVTSTMKVQENEIKDVSLLFLDDHCKSRLSDYVCPITISRNSNNTYSGYVSLKTLINEKYIDIVSLQGEECSGCVIYTENKPEVYLICGEKYTTESSVNFKSVCNLN